MLNLVPIALVVAAAVAAAGYATSVSSTTDRADCPGKIICPLTGELVCKDECPVGSDAPNARTDAHTDARTDAKSDPKTIEERAENPSCCESKLVETEAIRLDCPGKIVCPLTGELVCEDRCPLGDGQSEAKAVSPGCCETLN